jgi:hypothetical protein
VVVEEYRAPGAPEQEVFGAEGGLWDVCSVIAHFGLEHDIDATLAVAWDVLGGADSSGSGGGEQEAPEAHSGGEHSGGSRGGGGGAAAGVGWRYAVEPVVNAEWVEQIKASYVPLQINPQLYIVPTWSEPEDAAALNIILEPGVAFGTGGWVAEGNAALCEGLLAVPWPPCLRGRAGRGGAWRRVVLGCGRGDGVFLEHGKEDGGPGHPAAPAC